ncbi:MAG: hypothetical protein ABEN55_04145 [Bradymonadaceae bacterium]
MIRLEPTIQAHVSTSAPGGLRAALLNFETQRHPDHIVVTLGLDEVEDFLEALESYECRDAVSWDETLIASWAETFQSEAQCDESQWRKLARHASSMPNVSEDST